VATAGVRGQPPSTLARHFEIALGQIEAGPAETIVMRQHALFSDDTVAHFDGKTYDPALDHDRLAKQLGRVFDTMSKGRWLGLGQIQASISVRCGKRDSEAGISARLRDLRKNKFGGYVVERRRSDKGYFEYKLGGHDNATTTLVSEKSERLSG
jgi:hypothetical protein